MVMKHIRNIGLLVFLILFNTYTYIYGQNPDKLPLDPLVKTGSLDNGIRYYIVNNKNSKGFVDIALVQNTGYKDESKNNIGESIISSRGALSDLPRFMLNSPFSFLKRKSIFPTDNGYVSVSENATIYRFKDIVVAKNNEALDSSLLMIFDIIANSTRLGKRYSTQNQAIIIVGDVDPKAVLNKMDMLALFVVNSYDRNKVIPYTWKEQKKKKIVFKERYSDSLTTISIEYRSQRTPRSLMNTVQYLVSSKFAREFLCLLENRVSLSLHKHNIPYYSLKSDYIASAHSLSDEKLVLNLSLSRRDRDKAISILSSVLSELNYYAASMDDYNDVRQQLRINSTAELNSFAKTNSVYMDRCISSFLSNSPLSSELYNYSYFNNRKIDRKKELSLFNTYISSLIDKDRNLSIYIDDSPSDTLKTRLLELFDKSWELAKEKPNIYPSYEYIASILSKYSKKARLKYSNIEPMTGADMWIFSNGITVIYKKVDDVANSFNYSLLLRTGLAQATDMSNEYRPYLNDLLKFSSIGDLDNYTFRKLLESNTIDMNVKASLTDFTIYGSAQNDKIEVLLNTLIALANDRNIAKRDFEYYRDSEKQQIQALMESSYARELQLDSILRPNISYSKYKRAVKLSYDFIRKSNQFYENIFSKINDGVFIITGNIDKEELKTILSRTLGAFRTEYSSSFRAKMRDDDISGKKILYNMGNKASLDLLFYTSINYTSENYMYLTLASMCLKDAIMQEVTQQGWTGYYSSDFSMFPSESFTLKLFLQAINVDGIPASMQVEANPRKLVKIINNRLAKMSIKAVDEQSFEKYRAILSNSLDRDMTKTKSLHTYLSLRYSYGKDLITNYKERLASLSCSKLNQIISDIINSTLIENVIETVVEENLSKSSIPIKTFPKPAYMRESLDSTGILKLSNKYIN